MSFFQKWGDKLSAGLKRLSGRTDILEAVCAAAALVAYADGEVSDKEILGAKKAISSNPTLAGTFGTSKIDKVFDQMLKRAEGGRVGQATLLKELSDIASDAEAAELAFLSAVDVAESEGGISAAERTVLEKVGRAFGLNPSNYL